LTSYLLLFFWAFLSATLIPVGSEPYFVLLVQEKQTLLTPVCIASAGNIAGGLLLLLTGMYFQKFIRYFADTETERFIRIRQKVQKYGSPLLLLSWVPIAGDLLVLAAGLLRMPFAACLFMLSIGKIARFLILGYTTLSLL
jgi:membrane protein YqaA with SNARE-associated domain